MCECTCESARAAAVVADLFRVKIRGKARRKQEPQDSEKTHEEDEWDEEEEEADPNR